MASSIGFAWASARMERKGRDVARIALIIWTALTIYAAVIIQRHHLWAASLPALVVLVWYANAIICLFAGLRWARRSAAERSKRSAADRAELIKAATAELARQQNMERRETSKI